MSSSKFISSKDKMSISGYCRKAEQALKITIPYCIIQLILDFFALFDYLYICGDSLKINRKRNAVKAIKDSFTCHGDYGSTCYGVLDVYPADKMIYYWDVKILQFPDRTINGPRNRLLIGICDSKDYLNGDPSEGDNGNFHYGIGGCPTQGFTTDSGHTGAITVASFTIMEFAKQKDKEAGIYNARYQDIEIIDAEIKRGSIISLQFDPTSSLLYGKLQISMNGNEIAKFENVKLESESSYNLIVHYHGKAGAKFALTDFRAHQRDSC